MNKLLVVPIVALLSVGMISAFADNQALNFNYIMPVQIMDLKTATQIIASDVDLVEECTLKDVPPPAVDITDCLLPNPDGSYFMPIIDNDLEASDRGYIEGDFFEPCANGLDVLVKQGTHKDCTNIILLDNIYLGSTPPSPLLVIHIPANMVMYTEYQGKDCLLLHLFHDLDGIVNYTNHLMCENLEW